MVDRTKWALYVGVIVLACGVGIAGYAYHARELASTWADSRAELKVIAGLRAGEIARWRQERLKDARLDALALVVPPVRILVERAGGEAERLTVLARLKIFQEVQGYQNVIVARTDGRVLLSADPRTIDIEPQTLRLVEQAIAAGDAVVGDLFRCEVCLQVHMDTAVPVLDDQERPVAVLILRTDPEAVLFPLVQSWPTTSPSAETLLVRKDGDEALILNVLRHVPDRALTLRFPLAGSDMPAVHAALGLFGEFDGRDYRGVEVLAEIRPVAGSSWFIVSKVDKDELFADVYEEGGLILLLVFLVIVMMGILGQLLSRTWNLRLQKTLLGAERAARDAETHFRDFFENAPIGKSMTLPDGRLHRVNPAFCRMLGYSADELSALSFATITHPDDLAESRECVSAR